MLNKSKTRQVLKASDDEIIQEWGFNSKQYSVNYKWKAKVDYMGALLHMYSDEQFGNETKRNQDKLIKELELLEQTTTIPSLVFDWIVGDCIGMYDYILGNQEECEGFVQELIEHLNKKG